MDGCDERTASGDDGQIRSRARSPFAYSTDPELIGPDPCPLFNYEQIMRLTEFSSSRIQWHKHDKFPAQNGTRFHRTNRPETCHTRYDPNGNQIQITKPEGNIVEYDYDEPNIRIAQRVGYTTTEPAIAAVTIFIFDNNGNSLAVIGPAERGTADNSLTATIADAFGGTTSLVHTGDWHLMNTYDGFDRVTQAADAVGQYTATLYDPGSRSVETNRYGTLGGPAPADRTGTTNQLLSTQITRYDEAGREYEKQNDVFIASTLLLPSDRSVAHTGGGLASNSTANNHDQTVTLTAGGQSYVLTRTVYDRADSLRGFRPANRTRRGFSGSG